MRERHNNILQRLCKALLRADPAVTVLIDQKIPGSPGQLRPDLVITDNRDHSVSIVDVTIPLESSAPSFETAQAQKTSKYSELVSWAKSIYSSVNFGVFIIGSLSSWDPDNVPVLHVLLVFRTNILYSSVVCVVSMSLKALSIFGGPAVEC